MALHLSDVVRRRLELGGLGPPPPATVEEILKVMAAERGWDAPTAAAEREALSASYALPTPV
jgi:glycerol-3-phosphate dehydrogenase